MNMERKQRILAKLVAATCVLTGAACLTSFVGKNGEQSENGYNRNYIPAFAEDKMLSASADGETEDPTNAEGTLLTATKYMVSAQATDDVYYMLLVTAFDLENITEDINRIGYTVENETGASEEFFGTDYYEYVSTSSGDYYAADIFGAAYQDWKLIVCEIENYDYTAEYTYRAELGVYDATTEQQTVTTCNSARRSTSRNQLTVSVKDEEIKCLVSGTVSLSSVENLIGQKTAADETLGGVFSDSFLSEKVTEDFTVASDVTLYANVYPTAEGEDDLATQAGKLFDAPLTRNFNPDKNRIVGVEYVSDCSYTGAQALKLTVANNNSYPVIAYNLANPIDLNGKGFTVDYKYTDAALTSNFTFTVYLYTSDETCFRLSFNTGNVSGTAYAQLAYTKTLTATDEENNTVTLHQANGKYIPAGTVLEKNGATYTVLNNDISYVKFTSGTPVVYDLQNGWKRFTYFDFSFTSSEVGTVDFSDVVGIWIQTNNQPSAVTYLDNLRLFGTYDDAEPVTGVTVSENTVSWTADERVGVYNVYVNGTLVGSTTEASYTLSGYEAGKYTVSVSALPKATGYKESEPTETVWEFYEKLAAPVPSKDENLNLTWAPVANATEYEVYIDNSLFASTDATSIVLKQDVTGTHTVQVKAINKTNVYYSDSDFSEELTYDVTVVKEKLTVTGLSVSEHTVTWNVNENASSYAVYVSGVLQEEGLTENKYEIDPEKLGTGTLTVRVEATPSNTDAYTAGFAETTYFEKGVNYKSNIYAYNYCSVDDGAITFSNATDKYYARVSLFGKSGDYMYNTFGDVKDKYVEINLSLTDSFSGFTLYNTTQDSSGNTLAAPYTISEDIKENGMYYTKNTDGTYSIFIEMNEVGKLPTSNGGTLGTSLKYLILAVNSSSLFTTNNYVATVNGLYLYNNG